MAIILFDGVCNLCNGFVQWVLRRDPKGQFRFASLQSDTGATILKQHGLPPGTLDSVLLSDGKKVYMRSDAVLEVARRLGGGWSLVVVLKIIPRFLRDAIYKWIAKNRYHWFGASATCWLPRAEWRDRFL